MSLCPARVRKITPAVALAMAVLVPVGGAQAGGSTAAATGAAAASATPASPAVGASAATPEVPSGWRARGEDFPGTVVTRNVSLPMSDGLVLKGDLVRPARADGSVVTGRLPVLVQITAYNKQVVSGGGGGLAGGDPDYLVRRGYAYLVVDARGTGTSPGTWQVFGPREQKDAGEIVEWAASRPWSNGRVGMLGASYMGISQLFAAGQRPQGLRAIFPQVPSAEVYRDVVASGGQLDVGFMPLWLGLVNLTGLIPGGDAASLATILGRLAGTNATTLQLAVGALASGKQSFDGPYYRDRSTLLRAVPRIDVPVFLVGGHHDLFQRGTPLIFQALRERGVPVKMVLGPWDHLEGSSGAPVADAGYGSLDELRLRWFDRYVRGTPDRALDSDIPAFTYYELGSDRWVKRPSYLSGQSARVLRLSGSGTTALSPGRLTEGRVAPGTATVLPVPVSGLCSRSASQWTAGTSGMLPLPNPCDDDNRLNDLTGVVYETTPMASDLRVLGPIGARLHASSSSGDGMLSVHVSRVTPEGRVQRLTGGWQVVSLAALDRSRSTVLDGEVVQPWHPFTRDSRRVRRPGEVTPVDVEVFPTGAVFRKGDRVRISVQAFDVPHLAPSLGLLNGAASVITLHTSPRRPSQLVLPSLSPAPRRTTARHAAGGTAETRAPAPASRDGRGDAGSGGGPARSTTEPGYDATEAAREALARAESRAGSDAEATGLDLVAALRDPADHPLPLAAVALLVLLGATGLVRRGRTR